MSREIYLRFDKQLALKNPDKAWKLSVRTPDPAGRADYDLLAVLTKNQAILYCEATGYNLSTDCLAAEFESDLQTKIDKLQAELDRLKGQQSDFASKMSQIS